MISSDFIKFENSNISNQPTVNNPNGATHINILEPGNSSELYSSDSLYALAFKKLPDCAFMCTSNVKAKKYLASLVICEGKRCTIFDINGSKYTCRLPSVMDSVWNLGKGLLFQCKTEKAFVNEENHSFSWFSVSHPLDELAPVVQCIDGVCNFATNPNIEIIKTIPEKNLVLTRNAKTDEHQIWKARPSITKDYSNLYVVNAEGEIKVGVSQAFDSVKRMRNLSLMSTSRFDNTRINDEHISLSPFEQSVHNLSKGHAQGCLSPYIEQIYAPKPTLELDRHIHSMSSIGSGRKLHPLVSSPVTPSGRYKSVMSSIFYVFRPIDPHLSDHLINFKRFAADEVFGVSESAQEPLLPQICLTLIWSEFAARNKKNISHRQITKAHNKSNIPHSSTTMPTEWKEKNLARRAFLAENFLNNIFFCFMTKNEKREAEMMCLKFNPSLKNEFEPNPSFLELRDAIYVDSSKLIVALERQSNIISLYSGPHKICLLDHFLLASNPFGKPFDFLAQVPCEAISSHNFGGRLQHEFLTYSQVSHSVPRRFTWKDIISLPAQEYTLVRSSDLVLHATERRKVDKFLRSVYSNRALVFENRNIFNQSSDVCSFRLHIDKYDANDISAAEIFLPPLSLDSNIDKMFKFIEKILPENVSILLHSNWYIFCNGMGCKYNGDHVLPGAQGVSHSERIFSSFLHFLRVQLQIKSIQSNRSSDEALFNQKRSRPREEIATNSDWSNFLELISEDIENFEPANDSKPSKYRIDPNLRYLPYVFVALHLFFEEMKLSQLVAGFYFRVLAEFQLDLARYYLKLESYVSYYSSVIRMYSNKTEKTCIDSMDCESSNQDDPFPFLPEQMAWPDNFFRYSSRPFNLLNIAEEIFTRPTLSNFYFYIPGANDLSALVISMLLAARMNSLSEQQLNFSSRAVRELEVANVWDQVLRPLESKTVINSANILRKAFVISTKIVLDSNSIASNILPHQFLVQFLNQLTLLDTKSMKNDQKIDESQPRLQDFFNKNILDIMEPSIGSIINLLFSTSPTEGPTFTTSIVNQLLNCNDILRQSMILEIHKAAKECNDKHPKRIWSTRNFWENSIRLSDDVGPIKGARDGQKFRHPQLFALENHPVNRLAFRQDLRLREAYKLLQTSSHLPVPCFNNIHNEHIEINIRTIKFPYLNTFNRAPISAASYLEAAQEMHYTAMAVRCSALPIGRGMLFLRSLCGKNVPASLNYQPICLRGTAQSPQTGTHKFMDMTKLSGMSLSVQNYLGMDNLNIGTRGNQNIPTNQLSYQTGIPRTPDYLFNQQFSTNSRDIFGNHLNSVHNGFPHLPSHLTDFVSTLQGSETFTPISDDPLNAQSLAASVSITASAQFGSFRSLIIGSPQSGLPHYSCVRDDKSNRSSCNPADLLKRAFHFDSASTVKNPLDSWAKTDKARGLLGFHVLRAITAAASSATLFNPKSTSYLAALQWPEFHNGVSFGLSISSQAAIDATWILYNCSVMMQNKDENSTSTGGESSFKSGTTQSAAQAGMLLGFGLNGLLNHLAVYDIQHLLNNSDDLSNMSILIGLASGKRGSQDQALFRLFALHYRVLLTTDETVSCAADLQIPPLCETAAILGLGLLFQGSAHRYLVSLLLRELGQPLDYHWASSNNSCSNTFTTAATGGGSTAFNVDTAQNQINNDPPELFSNFPGNNDPSGFGFYGLGSAIWKTKTVSGAAGSGGITGKHREMISLTAGFALGLLLFGKSNEESGLGDLQIEDTLNSYIGGSKRPQPIVKVVHFDHQISNDLNTNTSNIEDVNEGLNQNNSDRITVPALWHRSQAPEPSRPLPIHLRSHMTTDAFSTLGRQNPYPQSSGNLNAANNWDTTLSRYDEDIANDTAANLSNGIFGSRLGRIASNLLRSELTAYDLPTIPSYDSVILRRYNQSKKFLSTNIDRNHLTPMWLMDPGPGSNFNTINSFFSSPVVPSGNTTDLSFRSRNQHWAPSLGRGEGDHTNYSITGPREADTSQNSNGNSSNISGDRWRHVGPEAKTLRQRNKRIGDSAHIYSGQNYITDINGLGSISAIALAYIGAGKDHPIAKLIKFPESLSGLEAIRPDMFLLRQIAEGLIMWDEIGEHIQVEEWLITPIAAVKSYVDTVKKKYERLIEIYLKQTAYVMEKSKKSSTFSEKIEIWHRNKKTSCEGENKAPDFFYECVELESAELATSTFDNYHRKDEPQLLLPEITRLLEHDAPSSVYNIFIDCEMVASAHLMIMTGRVFTLGLRYAGTADAQVSKQIRSYIDNICNDNWWPPKCPLCPPKCTCLDHLPTKSFKFPLRSKPSLQLINDALVTSILALSFVQAGSGNLDTLKLIKKVRTLKLFNDYKIVNENLQSVEMETCAANKSMRGLPRLLNSDVPNVSLTQATFQKYAMAHYSALFSASRIALREDVPVQLQQPPVSGVVSGTASGTPLITLTSVMGTLLDPLNYGQHQALASATGLLFLGGGRLTLDNSKDAAAMLFISFFPKYATFAGDNFYHLQAFRHLYVLAIRPRKLSTVDIDTQEVVESNLLIKLKNGEVYKTEGSLILNSDLKFENIQELIINSDSQEYWPRSFQVDSPHFEIFKTAFEDFGYIYVKRKRMKSIYEQLMERIYHTVNTWWKIQSQYQIKRLINFLESLAKTCNGSFNKHKNLVTELNKSIERIKSLNAMHFFEHRNLLIGPLRSVLQNTNQEFPHDPRFPEMFLSFKIWLGLPDENTEIARLYNQDIQQIQDPDVTKWKHIIEKFL